MSTENLQNFIQLLQQQGDLRTIHHQIDPFLEMTEIIDRVSKKDGPAILFKNPKGSQIPVAMNLFGSQKRIATALGVQSIDSLAEEIQNLIHIKPPKSLLEGVQLIQKYGKAFKHHPKTLRTAPCQEVLQIGPDVNIQELPVLHCWPEDAGPFITLPIVITRDPEQGTLNAGMYRMQVYNKNTTGMHWHKHHDGARHFRKYQRLGRRMEVAVALGGPPSIIFAATAPLPPFLDELSFACFLMKSNLPMIQCKTISLKVPAEAEIILEGYIDPHESFQKEGPFGDHTGYYSAADMFPVFHITAITRRRNAVYPTIIVGKPPMEDTHMGKVTERLFLPLIRIFIPEIVDMNFPAFGVFHNFVFISIKKEYAFQAKKVMTAIWGIGQLMLTKYIIVVDADVNVHNEAEVLWRMSNNTDPRRDTLIIDGPLDQLDHSSPYLLGGAKMGFDATTRFPEEEPMRPYPKTIQMTPEVIQKIDTLWATLFEQP